MKTRDIAATFAGVVAVGASAAAALAIRLMLTSPTTVAGMTDGRDGLQAVAHALYEALAYLVRYL